MAKTKISEFSATPANNTDIDSINIAEGCAPSGINDAIRELMSQLKDFQTGAVGDSFNGPIGSSTASTGAFTTLSASSTLGVTGVSTLTGGAVVQGLTVGRGAGAVSTNTAVGASAGNGNTTGAYNTYYGYAVTSNSAGVTGSYNVGIGAQSVYAITSGSYNVGVGAGALSSNTTASNNTAVGYQAGYSNVTGTDNFFGGAYAGYSNTGSAQVFIGKEAGKNNTSGASNVAIGFTALVNNTTGSNNTAIGSGVSGVSVGALGANTTGSANTAIGQAALFSNTTASNNTAVGYQAGYNVTVGEYNTYLGGAAANAATTGTRNTFIGYGSGSTVTTGDRTSILGRFNGNQGGLDIRTASNYIVLSDGDGNPRQIINSSGDLLIGTASTTLENSRSFVWIGSSGGLFRVNHSTANGSGDGYMEFGYNGTKIGSITQSGTTAVLYNVTSDQRLKENIADADSASTLIDSLQVRKFDWKTDQTHQRYGFVAQELVTVAPEAVHQPSDTEEMMAVDYSKLVPMLVKEIQSLRVRVAQLEAKGA